MGRRVASMVYARTATKDTAWNVETPSMSAPLVVAHYVQSETQESNAESLSILEP